MNALVGRPYPEKGSNKGGGEKKILLCSNCKKTNHTIDKCYFIHGFPANYRDRSKKGTQETKFAGSAQAFTPEQMVKLMSLIVQLLERDQRKEQTILQALQAPFMREPLMIGKPFKDLYLLESTVQKLAGGQQGWQDW